MAKILKAINESCVTRAEFPFSKDKKQQIYQFCLYKKWIAFTRSGDKRRIIYEILAEAQPHDSSSGNDHIGDFSTTGNLFRSIDNKTV